MLDDDATTGGFVKSLRLGRASGRAPPLRFSKVNKTEPVNVEPLHTAIAEIDSRRPLWTRASEACFTLSATSGLWVHTRRPGPSRFSSNGNRGQFSASPGGIHTGGSER
jgi:hypothetical protein